MSFENLTRWFEEYKHYTIPDKVVRILIGNKSDLTESRRIESKVAEKFAQQYSMPFYEVSSKNDDDKEHIKTIFKSIARKLLKEKGVVVKRASILQKTSNLQSKNTEKKLTLKNDKEKLEIEKKKCCGSGSHNLSWDYFKLCTAVCCANIEILKIHNLLSYTSS